LILTNFRRHQYAFTASGKIELRIWNSRQKARAHLGRRGDFSSSEPSSGEKPVS